jgi:transcriptional repressor NrdR
VRFASVYRDFKDLPDFVKALEGLMGAPPASMPPPAPRPAPRPAPPSPASEASPFKSTPLFPGVAQEPDPPKRRKSR